uniref:Ionotropic glutamate receptor C-terminal domain-containing protein n=1 Tax=Daphnia galeata TaxID=27404 RepID=A0A8J2RJU2_9CRUS|nr:unnamed protein product [Daphnia galeata]
MPTTFTFIIVIIWSNIWTIGYSSSTNPSSNPLNGQHLRVIWPLWSGNPKGLSGPLKGGVILEYLTKRFNFTYEMVRVTEHSVKPSANGKGLFSYLQNQTWWLQLYLSTDRLLALLYITVPWVFTTAAILAHIPDETLNVNAIIKPFQWAIWLGLGISIVCVTSVLILLQKFNEKQFGDGRLSHKKRYARQYLYVLGNLLSQGGPCTSNRFSFRLVAGAWSVAAFILIQAYNSTLFPYVMTPINNPLINSPDEIPERNDVHLLIKRGGSTDIVLSASTFVKIFTKSNLVLLFFKNVYFNFTDMIA